MKKLLIIICIVLMFSSCETQTPTPPKLSDEVTVLKIMLTSAQKDIIEQTKVLRDVTEINENYFDALKIKLESENPPTLFYLEKVSQLPQVLPFLEELSSESWVDKLHSEYLSNLTFNGRVYAMPQTVHGVGIIYNSDILKAANVNPQNLNSQSRLKDAAEILDLRIQNGDFSKTHPQLKTVYSDSPEKLKENRAVMTFCSTKLFSQPTATFRLIPVSLDGVFQEKIFLEFDGVWCINKNAPPKEKAAARVVLYQIYQQNTAILTSSSLLNDVYTLTQTGNAQTAGETYLSQIATAVSKLF